ncbi:protoheme IX biogenesis protein HemY, partial [Erwinia amylovora]|nr:protoheme IX biogenesis protein HemY [Erwinia amylovora]
LGLMNQSMADQVSDGLKRGWQNLSRNTRNETALQVAMADHLNVCDDHDTAQTIVLVGLTRHFDERLELLMPRLKTCTPQQLEKALRQQIKQHGA